MEISVASRVSGRRANDISDSIENAIRDGRLTPGSKLPTVRALAEELAVSPSTVSSAYRYLRQRGVISTHGRGGTRVHQRPPIKAREDTPVPADVRDLTRTREDDDILPALSEVLHDVADRLPGSDAPRLAERLTKEFEADGIEAPLVTAMGSPREALDRVLESHLLPGDKVAMEDPGSAEIADVLLLNGLEPVALGMDERGVLPGDLAAALPRIAACVLTPRGQDPTGAVMDLERASEIRTVLRTEPSTLVIEWDPLGPVAGVPYEPLTDPGRSRWAVVRSYEALLGSRLGIAALGADPVTMARVEGRVERLGSTLPGLLRRVVDELLGHPSAAQRLNLSTRTQASRRIALLAELRARGIQARGQAGPFVWVPTPDPAATVGGMLGRGWLISGVEAVVPEHESGVRISAARLDPRTSRNLADDLLEVLAA